MFNFSKELKKNLNLKGTVKDKLKYLDKILHQAKELSIFSDEEKDILAQEIAKCEKNIEKIEIMEKNTSIYGPDISMRMFIEHRSLRPDIDDFQPSFEKEHLCPFCENEHYYYKEITNDSTYANMHNAYSPQAIFTSFHICYNCNEIGNNIEWERFTLEKVDNVRENQATTNYRLQQYIYQGILEGGIGWAHSDLRSNACFFCRDSISVAQYINPWETLLVPVDLQDHGGVVHSCEACAIKYSKDNKRHYLHTDKCIRCKEDYPITEELKNHRVKNNSYNECICPKCFEDIYGTEIYDVTVVFSTCNDCGVIESIDRREHQEYVRPETISFCPDCRIKEDFIFTKSRGKPMKYWLGILKENDGTFKTEVYKCSSSGKYGDSVVVYTSRGHEDSFTATDRGLHQLDLHYNPLKLKV